MKRLVSRRAAALVATVTFALGIPLGIAVAAHQFGDVPNSNPFHKDIAAIADAGVTSGCGGGNYCPKSAVTREQMAAFMNRLGALSADKAPVVNADKLDGLHAGSLTRFAYAAHDGQSGATPFIRGTDASDGSLRATIVAPAAGYLNIAGNGWLYFTDPEFDEIRCQLLVNDDQVPGSVVVQAGQEDFFGAEPPTVARAQSCSPSAGYRICKSGTYHVDLEFADIAETRWVIDASVTVEYMPFDGAGNPPGAGCLTS